MWSTRRLTRRSCSRVQSEKGNCASAFLPSAIVQGLMPYCRSASAILNLPNTCIAAHIKVLVPFRIRGSLSLLEQPQQILKTSKDFSMVAVCVPYRKELETTHTLKHVPFAAMMSGKEPRCTSSGFDIVHRCEHQCTGAWSHHTDAASNC